MSDNLLDMLDAYSLRSKPKRPPDQELPNGLKRWVLAGNPRQADETLVYLHRIDAGDAREPHNHPWPFAVRILSGGYSADEMDDAEDYPAFRPVSHAAGSSYVVPHKGEARGFWHRINEVEKDTWTLMAVGPRASSWGFLVSEDAPVEDLTGRYPVAESWLYFPHYRYVMPRGESIYRGVLADPMSRYVRTHCTLPYQESRFDIGCSVCSQSAGRTAPSLDPVCSNCQTASRKIA